jgi:Holliday junction resolvase YEN1
VQAAKGGSNPAIRTLFYRLVRLLGHSIQPLFVFDGPNKPAFKRGKRSTGTGDSTSNAMMKRLIRLFGFTVHDAPGEAEAECALLQQKGVVDAVLSEDVDTIMFGCGKTMRSWSAESKNGQTPTHVTIYDAEMLRQGEKGLDREGMVLVALMSGGDYIPEGIPNCGVKLACEAARAGFGASLCRIKRSDHNAIDAWKADLLHELRTNEKGFFRTKHKALTIPESFPNMEVLRYYTHPVVSQQSTVERLGQDFPLKPSVDITGLREFVRDTFDWTYREGAVKLVRVLAPSLLVQSMLAASIEDVDTSRDRDTEKRMESTLVKAISSRRTHFSTDAMPELRLSYVPIDVVPLDLDSEPVEEIASFGREGLALNSDEEFDGEVADVDDGAQTQKTKTKPFDVLSPNLVWVPELIVQLGVPLTFEDWEESQRQKTLAKEAAAAAPKRSRKRPVKKPDVVSGSLDKWLKVTKNVPVEAGKDAGSRPPRARSPIASLLSSPRRSDQPEIQFTSSPRRSSNFLPDLLASPTRSKPTRKPRTNVATLKQTSSSSTSQANPWSLAGSQVSARVTKSSSSGQPKPPSTGAGHARATTPTRQGLSSASQPQEPIVITSSPVVPASPALPETRMTRQQPLQDPAQTPTNHFPSSAQQPAPTSPKTGRKQSAPSPSPLPAKRPTHTRSSRATTRQDELSGMKQASIRNYGIVGRAPQPSNASTNSKAVGVSNSDPIIFLSDDDDEAPPAAVVAADAPMPRPSRREFKKAATFAGPYGDSGGDRSSREAVPLGPEPLSDDDDFPSLHDMIGERQGMTATPKFLTPEKNATKKTRVYMPRTSAVGYFKPAEVEVEEAHRMGRERRAFRQSDVSVIDMTGPDP